MPAPDFGEDVFCDGDGVPPTFELVSGPTVLVQALLRRFQTERGTLIDDENYGLNVQSWVGKRTDTAQIFAWQQSLVNEAQKDQRVQKARARIVTDPVSQKLFFTLTVETAEGPFTLTVAVSAVSVELLSVN